MLMHAQATVKHTKRKETPLAGFLGKISIHPKLIFYRPRDEGMPLVSSNVTGTVATLLSVIGGSRTCGCEL